MRDAVLLVRGGAVLAGADATADGVVDGSSPSDAGGDASKDVDVSSGSLLAPLIHTMKSTDAACTYHLRCQRGSAYSPYSNELSEFCGP